MCQLRINCWRQNSKYYLASALKEFLLEWNIPSVGAIDSMSSSLPFTVMKKDYYPR